MSTDLHVRAEIEARRELAATHLHMIALNDGKLDEVDIDLLRNFVDALSDSLLIISKLEQLEQVAEIRERNDNPDRVDPRPK